MGGRNEKINEVVAIVGGGSVTLQWNNQHRSTVGDGKSLLVIVSYII